MWPLAVATALIQVLVMAVIHHSDPFSLPQSKSVVAALLTFGLAISMTLLIVLTVQQEAIPSVNQDWLTRPVVRRDLLVGKLVTLVLLVHGPIVVVDVLEGLAEGFPLGSVLRATLNSNCEIALVYSLPVLAVAAMTRTVVEAIILGLVVLLILVLFGSTVAASTSGTGLKWIWRTVSHGELLLATVAALCWQYFRRSREATQQARAVFAGGVVLFTLIPALPWGPAFSIQQAFSVNPQAGRQVGITFAWMPATAVDAAPQLLADRKTAALPARTVRLALPLRFSGVPGGAMVHVDRSTVRLVRDDGAVVYRGLGETFDVPGNGMQLQTLDLPKDVYSKLSEQTLRMELEYFASVLRGTPVSGQLGSNDTRRLPGFGWCATRVDGKNNTVEVGCRQIGAFPFCISMALGSGHEKFVCELNYEPVPLRFSTDPIDHVEATLPRNAADGSSGVAIRVYEPEDHFFRQVAVPGMRLKDWYIAGT